MKKLDMKGISHLLIPIIVVVIGVAAVGTYMKVSSNAATVCAGRTLGVGSSGKCVKSLQILIKKLYIADIKVDGQYGNATKLRVMKTQATLGITPDGVAGKSTWKSICGQGHKVIYDYGKGDKTLKNAYKNAGCKAWF